MLAGWPVSSIAMLPMAELFEEHFHCISLDLPGFGGSEANPKMFCGFDYHLDIIRKFHEKILDTQTMSILGYSTGGIHAINYTSNFSTKIDKIVCFSAPVDGPEQFAEMESDSATRVKAMKTIYPYLTKYPLIRKFLNIRFLKLITIGILFVVVYPKLYPKMFQKLKKRTLLGHIRLTSNLNIKTAFDLAIDMSTRNFSYNASKLVCPTLVLSASHDKAVKYPRSKRLAELIPNGHFYIVPDADHTVGITEPYKLAPVIIQFLQTGTFDKTLSVA
jgi:pimeloyl-ACP methyl ester carboxylesterase